MIQATRYTQGWRIDHIVCAVPVVDAPRFFDAISDPDTFHLDLFESQCPVRRREVTTYAFCAVIHPISCWNDHGLWRLSFSLDAVVVRFADEGGDQWHGVFCVLLRVEMCCSPE